jgi:NTE family protein
MTMLRPARPREEPVTAFVMSGGGNQGVSQIGMLRALLERGIIPDVIIGTSAGALNGAAVATDPTLEKLDKLEKVWLGLTGEHVFPGGAFKRVWNVLRRDDHLISSEGLEEVITRVELAATFAELRIPLRVVTADLNTGDEIIFVNGPLPPVLLASAALPGIFPPVELHGHTLVDGAVVNLVPISHALAGPVDRIFVLDVSDPMSERPIRSPLDVLLRSFAISRDLRFELELQWVPKDVQIVMLPQPPDDRDFFDFSGGEKLIEDAYTMAIAALDDLDEHPGRQRRRRWWKRLAS